VAEQVCAICGERWAEDEYIALGEGPGCARCGGDPLCACGHQRSAHAVSCTETDYDFETLTDEPCGCGGYVAAPALA
jgi:hypothetical protein